mgnify:CR=1 FL=1
MPAKGTIAVRAQYAVSVWIALLLQPEVEFVSSSTEEITLLLTSSIHMVDHEKLVSGFSTTSTRRMASSVDTQNFQADRPFAGADLHVHFILPLGSVRPSECRVAGQAIAAETAFSAGFGTKLATVLLLPTLSAYLFGGSERSKPEVPSLVSFSPFLRASRIAIATAGVPSVAAQGKARQVSKVVTVRAPFDLPHRVHVSEWLAHNRLLAFQGTYTFDVTQDVTEIELLKDSHNA